jgi:starch-binding outer membrane protein, SusD/RagB family
VRAERSTVQNTYDQIISDLKEAIGLLPKTPAYKTRPSSVAARALLAKVYFAMGDYVNAKSSADQALNDKLDLLNFNTLTIGSANPFPTLAKGNPEVIFHAWGISYSLTSQSGRARIEPALYQSYRNGDLRKTAFFTADGSTGYYRFKGSYSANQTYFCGISTSEIYLLRAECLTRSGDLAAGLDDLNKLLKNRYTVSTFIPIQISDREQLLNVILQERRKELPFTGNVRWEDLRRLNRQTSTQVTITRTYKGANYTLAPNDVRYIFPIPDDEIQLNNLTQNIR